jgi:uncharacterized protein (TIGR02001 family)
MRKLIASVMALGAVAVPVAAQAEETGSFSGGIALTSNYVFRGFTQSDEGAAVQANVDYTNGGFYAGAWASTIDFGDDAELELDLYTGFTTSAGGIDYDFGIVAYLYPGSDGDDDYNFFEAYAKAGKEFENGFSLGGAFYITPENFGGTGLGTYTEASLGYAVSETVSLGGGLGYQTFDEGDDYTTWNVGLTFALPEGFEIDARYHDLDFEDADEQFSVAISKSF